MNSVLNTFYASNSIRVYFLLKYQQLLCQLLFGKFILYKLLLYC
jgi:hypothetical protein